MIIFALNFQQITEPIGQTSHHQVHPLHRIVVPDQGLFQGVVIHYQTGLRWGMIQVDL